jgi:hypothetical protein
MPFDLAKVNILAIVIGGLVAFLVGGLWYTVLFGKLWIKLHGFSEEKVKQMQASMSPPKFFGGMLLSYFVLAFILGVLLTGFTQPTVVTGITIGVLVWVATAAIAMTGFIASDKVLGIYLIDVGCQLVYLILMGIVLAVWR